VCVGVCGGGGGGEERGKGDRVKTKLRKCKVKGKAVGTSEIYLLL
jgi:hypothetical protein